MSIIVCNTAFEEMIAKARRENGITEEKECDDVSLDEPVPPHERVFRDEDDDNEQDDDQDKMDHQKEIQLKKILDDEQRELDEHKEKLLHTKASNAVASHDVPPLETLDIKPKVAATTDNHSSSNSSKPLLSLVSSSSTNKAPAKKGPLIEILGDDSNALNQMD
jgi:hypothetical protein